MKRTTLHLATAALTAAFSFALVPLAHADTKDQDKTFVENAAKGNLAEIRMAKLALSHSSNPEVLKFAKTMIHDHTMLEQSLIPFGQKFGVKAPTSLDRSDQDEYDRLSKKTGESFDKDYIQTMVDDHHNDLAAFTKEEQTTDNQALKATVAKGSTVIEHHMAMIDSIAHQYNIPVPSN